MQNFIPCSLLALVVLAGGCATSQKDKNLKNNAKLSAPIVPQMLAEAEKKIDFLQKAQGKGSSETLLAARKMGMIPYPVTTLPKIIREVDRGRPVIAFGGPEKRMVVSGYELGKEKLFLLDKETSFKEFLQSWEEGSYSAFVALPPESLSKERDLDALYKEAGKMKNVNPKAAKNVYKKLLELAPDRPEFYFARLENLEPGHKKKALSLTEKLVQIDPNNPAAWSEHIRQLKINGKQSLARGTARKKRAMFGKMLGE